LWGRPASEAAVEGIRPGEILSSTNEMHVGCGEGTSLRVDFVQLEGRKRVSAREFANGARIIPTDRFVSSLSEEKLLP